VQSLTASLPFGDNVDGSDKAQQEALEETEDRKVPQEKPTNKARIALTEAAAEMYDVNRSRIEAARDPRGGASWSIYDI
jgi:hypothetical protein